MKRTVASTYRPLARSTLPSPALAQTRRLTTSTAVTQTESTMFSTPLGRFYLGTACATATAWGALVFAHQWDEGGRRGDSTPTRLRNASTALATKSFIVVGLGAVWPLAPFLLGACGRHLDMERRCREIKQRRIDENHRLAVEYEKWEEARKRQEKEEQQRHEEQRRQEKKACDEERRKVSGRQVAALTDVDTQITARNAETVADRPPCPWCLQVH